MKLAVTGNGLTARAVREYLVTIGLDESPVDGADIVIMSPGVRPDAVASPNKISEVEFAYIQMQQQPRPPKLIGVTGTNGKSTVVTLLGYLLDCPVVGNIGDPLINHVRTKSEWLVVELSSFQLELCQVFRPDIGVFLNVAPDHLDRHGTMDEYVAAKSKLIAGQWASDTVVYNALDPHVSAACESATAQRVAISDVSDVVLPTGFFGAHNQLNVAACVEVARVAGVPEATIHAKLATFTGLPHRLEWVADIEERVVINDSKATNLHAVDHAIAAFPDNRIVLMMCGADKGLDLAPFFESLPDNVAHVIGFGAMGPRLVDAGPVVTCETMADAWEQAQQVSQPGDVILFSPGSSSFDQFTSFEDRGDQFKALVRS